MNYSTLDKEIKAALNVINKFEIFLINKKFHLRTDAAAMNNVLNKEVKKPVMLNSQDGRLYFPTLSLILNTLKVLIIVCLIF